MLLTLLAACELFTLSDLPTELPTTADERCTPSLAVEVITLEGEETKRRPLEDGLTLAVRREHHYVTSFTVHAGPTSTHDCRYELTVADVPGAEYFPPTVAGRAGTPHLDDDGCLKVDSLDGSVTLSSDTTGGLTALEGLKTFTATLTCPDEPVLTQTAEVEFALFDPYGDYVAPEGWPGTEEE